MTLADIRKSERECPKSHDVFAVCLCIPRANIDAEKRRCLVHGESSGRIGVLLNELTDLGVKVDAVLPDGTHLYWCTSHRCGDPDHCASPISVHGGAKTPGQCKSCGAKCREAIDE